MKVVIQRVQHAQVTVAEVVTGSIQMGLLVLVGYEPSDLYEDVEWICNKIVNLRIFNDDKGVMNRSLKEIDGQLLLVSQFTLHASTKKGNRPSYIQAAKPEHAIPLYEQSIELLTQLLEKPIACGVFGAHMEVSLLND